MSSGWPYRVVVCVDRLNPPYVSEELGELRGVTIDLVRRVFDTQQIEVDFYPVDGPMAQAVYLAAGRADAAADMTVTERRLSWFRFSRPYVVEELQVFMLRHGPLWAGLSRTTGPLGVKADSYAQEYLLRHYHDVRSIPMDSTERMLQALREERVLGLVMSRLTGAALLASGDCPDVEARGAPFGPAPLALATLPENEEILERFNAGLEAVGGGPGYAALLRAAAL
jgi:ABC-type amino acid transport substrate-binding protein